MTQFFLIHPKNSCQSLANLIKTMADPRLRQIFIKTGVVRRYAKEKLSYEKEAVTEQKRIQRFRDENRDEHDIRKQEEVIQENLMMIPECQRK